MSAPRIRPSVILGLAFGWVVAATGIAEGQIFRRPSGRPPQAAPESQPPRGLFPGLRRNPDPANTEGAVPRTTFRGGSNPGVVPGSSNSGGAFPGGAIPPQSTGPQEEIFIVVPLDEKPFQVEPTDYVRLTAGGPPGCEFSTKIEGPARVHRKVFVAGATEGKFTPGTDEAEYEFAMTGLGKVKIDVITTVPGAAAPTVMSYQFEVVAGGQ